MKFKDFEDFQDWIEEDFIEPKKKNILLSRLPAKLTKLEKCPTEYIEYYFDTISEPMPFHAAVSIIYLREYKFFSEKLPVFEKNLYHICEQKFIREISSDSPDLEYCANLHTALSLLNLKHIEKKITHAVETISEQWKKVLFKQISICIQAVNDFETEEQSLLAPILKSFYINYSAEINCDFLLKELKELEQVVKEEKDKLKTYRAAEITLSKILKSAIENKYFSYFKILYSLFPNWHMYREEKEEKEEKECEEFMELAFKYADSPEHLIDLLYVSLEILIGSDSLKTEIIEKWYNKIKSFNPKKAVEDIVSFIYYSKCIDAGDPKDYVVSMPYYEENKLFSEVLPAQSLPIGGIFVAKNTKTILKNNPWLLKEYLEKTGKNNIYHFDTELDCPEAPPINMDSERAIDSLCMYCNLETTIYCYFNTHLRKVYDIEDLFLTLPTYYYVELSFSYINIDDYIFKGAIIQKDNIWDKDYIFKTSQFLCSKEFYLYFTPNDIQELKYIFEKNSEKEMYLKLHFRYIYDTIPHFEAELLNTDFVEGAFTNIINEIIETHQLSEEQKERLMPFINLKLLSPNTVKNFVYAIETLSENPEQQKFLLESFCNFCVNYSESEYDKDIIKRMYLIAMKLKVNFGCLNCTISPAYLIDVKDLIESGFIGSWFHEIKGTIFWNEKENKFQLIPEKVICNKVPIFINPEYIISDIDENISNGIICTAYNVRYKYSPPEFEVKWAYTEKLKNKCRRIEHEFFKLTEEFCTNTTDNLLEKMKKTAEELKSYPIRFIPKKLKIEPSFILKTVENLVCKKKAERILPYLKLVKDFNSYEVKFPLEIPPQKYREEKEKLVENIIKQCDCETIAEIFEDTVLSAQLSLNVWLKLIAKYGKRSEMLKYFKKIPFYTHRSGLKDNFVYLSDFDDEGGYTFSDYYI